MDRFEKKYYKIREVAEILGLPPSTLRFWESRFTIIKPKRNELGIVTIGLFDFLLNQDSLNW